MKKPRPNDTNTSKAVKAIDRYLAKGIEAGKVDDRAVNGVNDTTQSGRCEWCRWSRVCQADEAQITCYKHKRQMPRNEICGDYEREPGADDNKARVR